MNGFRRIGAWARTGRGKAILGSVVALLFLGRAGFLLANGATLRQALSWGLRLDEAATRDVATRLASRCLTDRIIAQAPPGGVTLAWCECMVDAATKANAVKPQVYRDGSKKFAFTIKQTVSRKADENMKPFGLFANGDAGRAADQACRTRGN